MIEEKVSTLPNIQFIQVSVVTGSILVFAHSEGTLDRLENFFRFRLFPNVVEGIVSAVCDAEKQEGQKKEETTYLKAVRDTGLFSAVSSAMNPVVFFDLRTVAALLLTLRGLRKVRPWDSTVRPRCCVGPVVVEGALSHVHAQCHLHSEIPSRMRLSLSVKLRQ